MIRSLIHLLSCDSLVWLLLTTQRSNNGSKGRFVSINLLSCEVEAGNSLGSNELLLFWSLSTIFNCILGRPTFIPTPGDPYKSDIAKF